MSKQRILGPHPQCGIWWCLNEAQAYRGGWCHPHIARLSKGIDVDKPWLIKHTEPCSFESCERPRKRRVWCDYHAQQFTKGRPMTPPPEHNSRGRSESWTECPIPACEGAVRVGAVVCQRHRELSNKYGMTQPGLVVFFGDGGCRVCGSETRMSIDHDHGCCPKGNVRKCGSCNRGLLCHGCNISAGNAKDSPALLRSLADYLENYTLLS